LLDEEGFHGRMPRALWASLVALAVFLAAAVAYTSLDRTGTRRADLVLDGGVPATLWLPAPGASDSRLGPPPPRGERPPAVVLSHGILGDRHGVSGVSRRLASAGYAVLAIDLDGHGQNRNPFRRTRARADSFHATLATAVEFLRALPHVDGLRIALAGYSMGGGASLDYATRDSGIDALLLISGGRAVEGPHTPSNVLVLVAENDPARIHARVESLAARLAGVERIEEGRTFGDVERGSGVRLVQVDGTDHMSIVWSATAAREMVAWLDAVFGIPRVQYEPAPDSRVLPVMVMALCLPFLVPGLGWVVGRVVPDAPELTGDGRGRDLAALAVALLVAIPLVGTGSIPGIVPLDAADTLTTLFLISGVGLLVWCSLRGELSVSALSPRPIAAILGAAVAMLGLSAMLGPAGAFFHGLALTPERWLVFAACTVALLPLSVAMQLLFRRGPPRSAAVSSAAGRIVVVAILILGIGTGALDPLLVFIVGPLVLVMLLVELLAAPLYAVSRNRLTIAVVDAGLLALVLSAVMPVRI
jgi:dienelactone hydrolase